MLLMVMQTVGVGYKERGCIKKTVVGQLFDTPSLIKIACLFFYGCGNLRTARTWNLSVRMFREEPEFCKYLYEFSLSLGFSDAVEVQ